MAKTQTGDPKSVTIELPVFAAVIAHVAHERGVKLPVVVTIQSGCGGPDQHFAIIDVWGWPVAIPCACHAEAAALVAEQAAPK